MTHTHTHTPPKWEKAPRLEDALYLCLSISLPVIISLCTVQHSLLLSLPPLSSITTPQHSSLKCNSSLCLVVQIKPRLFNDLLSGRPWLPRHVSSRSLCVCAKLSEPNFSYFAAKLVTQKSRTALNLLGGNTFCRLLNATTFFFFSARSHKVLQGRDVRHCDAWLKRRSAKKTSRWIARVALAHL